MSGVVIMTNSGEETRELGRALAGVLRAGDVVLLSGGLGAGKTELAKGVGAGLDVAEPIVSPTFTIAREYEGRIPLVHVDVYRLDRLQEVVDLGLEERDDAVTLVEWGDAASAAFPVERLEIHLEGIDAVGAVDERTITFTPCGASWLERDDLICSALGGSTLGGDGLTGTEGAGS